MQNPTIIFGPPGTGKTTRLLDILERELADGTSPDKIAFMSYTRKAVNEAVERAIKRFNINKNDLKFFKTVHSMAYYQLGLSKDDVLKDSQLQEFGGLVGLPISNRTAIAEGDIPIGNKYKGDIFLHLSHLSRSRKAGLRETWERENIECQYVELFKFNKAYVEYKDSINSLDFTDMIDYAIKDTIPPYLDAVIIDEAQDLYPMQWDYINHFCKNAKRVYIAGDPDQALYEWTGADPKYLLDLQGERIVLQKGYRVPASIHQLAKQVIDRCHNTYDKSGYASVSEVGDGAIHHLNSYEDVAFDNDESWFILARNSYLLGDIEDHIRNFGIPYSIKGRRGINKKDARAIEAWENLRNGRSCDSATIKIIYDYLKLNVGVKRGYKSLSTIQDGRYSLWDLKDRFGLLTDAPWHEAFKLSDGVKEYYKSVIRNYYSLNDTPIININTIHGVKGGEADNIFLLTDVARTSYNAMTYNADAEHRVFYVGITRAKQNLFIMQPQGNYYYDL
ncbi:MAG: ATP-dependent helicase [Nitrosopumilus sp.]|nr:ATP-dependent helicase [Nitrosopumilus sp.]